MYAQHLKWSGIKGYSTLVDNLSNELWWFQKKGTEEKRQEYGFSSLYGSPYLCPTCGCILLAGCTCVLGGFDSGNFPSSDCNDLLPLYVRRKLFLWEKDHLLFVICIICDRILWPMTLNKLQQLSYIGHWWWHLDDKKVKETSKTPEV